MIIDITKEGLREWLENKDPDEIVHVGGYGITETCTLSNYLSYQGFENVRTLYSHVQFGAAGSAKLPEWAQKFIIINDKLSFARDDSNTLTASVVIAILDNME